MQFSIASKTFCFKPNTKFLSQKPTRHISSVNLAIRSSPSSQVKYKTSSPSEDEIRRYVMGLSTMKDGTLYPVTSNEQVIKHFSSEKPDTIQKILQRKTKVLKSKSGRSMLEWIY